MQAAIADVQQKRALLQQAELNLQYTKIVAPVSGEVNKTVVVGLNVEPGQQLLTVVPLDEVWVTANFKETQLKHMQVGQKADIHVDSSGRTLHGHVDSIAGATGPLFSLLPPENATGNYVKIVQRVPVKIVLEPGENRDRQTSARHERCARRIPQMSTACAHTRPGHLAAQVQSLADRRRCRARGFHGGARHQHRQRRASIHGRKSGREQ